MQAINEYLKTQRQDIISLAEKGSEKPVNEVIGALIATSIIAWGFHPLFANLGGFFSKLFGDKKDKNKDNDKSSKSNDRDNKSSKSDDKEDNENNEKPKDDEESLRKSALESLMVAKKMNADEKDENVKKQNEANMKMLTACMYDKDGKEVPFDKIGENFKESMPEGTDFDKWAADMKKSYDEVANNPELQKQIKDKRAEIKPADLDKFVEDSKKEAQDTWKAVDEAKKKSDDLEKELADMEEKIKDAKGDDLKKLKEEIDKKKDDLEKAKASNPMVAAISATGNAPTKPAEEEPKPTEDKPKEEKSKEEIDKEVKKLEDDYKAKDKALDDEYQAKLDKETDKDKKKAIEDEWMKKSDELEKEKKTAIDKVKNGGKNKPEKDEDGNELKDEEITDPETGKKKKVVVHVGPKGGRFYYPDGKPKTPEHRVYLESVVDKATYKVPLRVFLHKTFRNQ